MRLRFEQQLKLGITPISEIELDLKSRNGLMPVLRGLKYVFNTPELNEKIFQILENEVFSGVKKTGRYGMSLWEILVLGVVRLSENADFDKLHDLSNEHSALRGILGIQMNDYTVGKKYSLQSIKDNVQLLDNQIIYKISDIIVEGAHGIIKKKEGLDCLALKIKADSFVVESNIHFPTDLNLLLDSLRKALEIISFFQKAGLCLQNRIQWKNWIKKTKQFYRIVSEIHRRKGGKYEIRLKIAANFYLKLSEKIVERIAKNIIELSDIQLGTRILTEVEEKKKKELIYFLSMAIKHIDLVNRRIILGEKIPHSEKVFSIFEPHVEWNSKGKLNKQVELGHNVLIATDQYHFILHGEVYEHQVDKQRTVKLGKKLEDQYGKRHKLEGISFDKNFFSLPAEKRLEKKFRIVVLPKPGKKSKRELVKSENADYRNLKRAHSGIEGNINQLEHNGLDKCPDKGIIGFKRYVAYGILSYNLHRLGKLMVMEERKLAKRKKYRQVA